MQDLNPAAPEQGPSGGIVERERTAEEIAAGQEAEETRLAEAAATFEADEAARHAAEDRPQGLRDWLMSDAGEQALGIDWTADDAPDFEVAMNALLQYEAQQQVSDPSFSVSNTSQVRRLRMVVRRAERLQLDSDKEVEAEKAETATEDYAQIRERVRAEATDNLQYIDLMLTALNDQPELADQMQQWQDYRRIVDAAPEGADQQAIIAKVNALDFSGDVPDPVAFVQREIFSYPGYDSGVSEATQAAIAAELGIPLPPKIDTGSQAQNAVGKMTSDAEGNPVPVWSEAAPLPVRPGVSMYADANANQYIKAEYNGHIVTIETTGWKGETVGEYLEALSFIAETERFGLTGFFQSVYQIDFNLAGDEGFDPSKVQEILQIMGSLLGGTEDVDGSITRPEQRRGYVQYLARLLSKSNSATGFENNQAATDEIVRELRLRDQSGRPNFDQIRQFGQFARRTYMSGGATYQDVRAELS